MAYFWPLWDFSVKHWKNDNVLVFGQKFWIFFLDVKNMLKTFRKHFGPLWDGTKFLKAIKCDVNVKNSIFNNTMYKPFKTCSKGLQNQNGPFLRKKCKIWTWVFRGLKYLSLRSFSETMMKIVEASFLIGQFLYITAVQMTTFDFKKRRKLFFLVLTVPK